MNWVALLIAFAIGAALAAAAATRFERTAPHWSRLRRLVTSAAVAPAAILVLVIIGTIWARATLPDGGERGSDITSFIFAVVGVVVAVPALVGGFVGAFLAEGRVRR